MTTQPTQPDIPTLTATLRDLVALLPAARAVQWERSPVPAAREDTSERAIGGPPSDPTADVALDERRLAVRGAVQRAETLLHRAGAALEDARRTLSAALDEWEGLEQ